MVQLKSTQISVLEAHWNSYTYSGTGAEASTHSLSTLVGHHIKKLAF